MSPLTNIIHQWVCADPLEPDVTPYVLSKLRRIEPIETSEPDIFAEATNSKPSAIERLPAEMLQTIASFCDTASFLRLRRCSQIIHAKLPTTQLFWCQALLSGALVDYLWDLDADACLRKNQEQRDPSGWDWERLARSLRQQIILRTALGNHVRRMQMQHFASENYTPYLTAFEKQCLQFCTSGQAEAEEFADAPLGLQNRCRIMRMIRDIEVLDRIEAEEPVIMNEDGTTEKQRHYGGLWGLDSLV